MKNNKIIGDLTRRQFLSFGAGAAGSAGLLATMGAFQTVAAAGADSSGYKALVCLYLTGGNDGFNTIVPTTSAAYSTYAKSRSALALSQGSLLGLNGAADDGNTYGLHPSMPEMQALFNGGHMAILGNVGTLVQPTTLAQFNSGGAALPLQLFSHADQQKQWWTGISNQQARTGWAGRIADFYANQGYSTRLAMNINVGGANYWQEGSVVQPYVLGVNGAPTMNVTNNPYYRGGSRAKASLDLLAQATTDGNMMVAQHAAIANNASAKVGVVDNALGSAGNIATKFPQFPNDNDLGAQMREVALMIKARASLGDARQIFFVRIGGFDFHNNHLGGQAELLRIVSQNVGAFWTAMNEIGAQNGVTLFTASDFGRSLNTNNGGTDHGWGSHHFVLGGAVTPGWYGQMPNLALGGPSDVGQGRVLPTTSHDQYAATLSRWFGVADADLDSIFPTLRNFGTRNLGFV